MLNFKEQLNKIGTYLDIIQNKASVLRIGLNILSGEQDTYQVAFRLEGESTASVVMLYSYEEVSDYLGDIADILEHGEVVTQGLMAEKEKLAHLANKIKQKEAH